MFVSALNSRAFVHRVMPGSIGGKPVIPNTARAFWLSVFALVAFLAGLFSWFLLDPLVFTDGCMGKFALDVFSVNPR